MSEKKPPGGGAGRDRIVDAKAEVRYFKGEEQFERWRREFLQNQDYELKLASLSKLSYSAADYEHLLVREAFTELKLTDYSYLVDQAMTKAEADYFYPLVGRIVAIICLLGTLVVLFSPLVLLVTAALGVAAGVSLYFTIKDRDEAINRAKDEAKEEIIYRNGQERSAYEAAEKKHQEQEDSRVLHVERLLAGEPGAVRLRLDEVLSKLRLSVAVEVEIEFYMNTSFIRVWLPPQDTIPPRTCEMLPSGRIQYQDKDIRVYNKQYFELCAAVMLQIVSNIFAEIPSFQVIYAAGIVNGKFSDDCVLTMSVPREKIENINCAPNAISAIQALEAGYECDTSLALSAISMLRPPEWEEITPKLLKSLRVRTIK